MSITQKVLDVMKFTTTVMRHLVEHYDSHKYMAGSCMKIAWGEDEEEIKGMLKFVMRSATLFTASFFMQHPTYEAWDQQMEFFKEALNFYDIPWDQKFDLKEVLSAFKSIQTLENNRNKLDEPSEHVENDDDDGGTGTINRVMAEKLGNIWKKVD